MKVNEVSLDLHITIMKHQSFSFLFLMYLRSGLKLWVLLPQPEMLGFLVGFLVCTNMSGK